MMSPSNRKPEPRPAQTAETVTNSSNKVSRYVMPGLCQKIVSEFRRRRGVIPTPRTIAMSKGIEVSVVTTALIHELYEEVEELRRLIGGMPVNRGMGVVRRAA